MTARTLLFAATGLLVATPALSGEPIHLTIRDHKFEPARIEVPAGEAFTLIVKNEDPTPEEFESHDLNREKVISGHGTGKITINALKPGEYRFVGEFHEDTAKGLLVAR